MLVYKQSLWRDFTSWLNLKFDKLTSSALMKQNVDLTDIEDIHQDTEQMFEA